MFDDNIEAWEVLDLLAGQVEKNLVFRDLSTVPARHRMLETVREYAAQKLLETGETESIRRRHAETFQALAEELEPELEGPRQMELLDQLEADHENLRAALRYWLEARDGVRAISLAAALWWYWYIRGYWSEGRELLRTALALPGNAEPDARLGKALYGAGILAYSQGDYDAADALYAESRIVRSAAGDRKGEAAVVGAMGLLAKERSEYSKARDLYGESLTIRREVDDRGGIAGSLNNLGVLLGDQGEHAEAVKYFEECLTIQRELGHTYAIATTLGNLGRSEMYLGDFETARERFQESFELRRQLGDRRGTLLAQIALAYLAQDEGDFASAQPLLVDCLAQAEAGGDVWITGYAALGLGNASLDQSDYPRALEWYRRTAVIRRNLGDRAGLGEAFLRIGQVYVRMGRLEEAVKLFGASDSLLMETGLQLPVQTLQERDREVARCRNALGTQTYDALFETGRGMGSDRAYKVAF